jgi:hypothetical protein
MIIVRSAYFRLCECQRAGYIVTVLGESEGCTPMFYSQEDGLMLLEASRAVGFISPEEFKIVGQQLEDSRLPRYSTVAMKLQMLIDIEVEQHLKSALSEPSELSHPECSSRHGREKKEMFH